MAFVLSIRHRRSDDIAGRLRPFHPLIDTVEAGGISATRVTGEFWTAGQRKASSLHEVSYRACFKPQLPRFFIDLLTQPGDVVFDPFSGRGTTALEAGLAQRRIVANDMNPLSAMLARPRLFVPDLEALRQRLSSLRFRTGRRADVDLSMFYHPRTESDLIGLRSYLHRRHRNGSEDAIDRWIRMVATNRLTGHSTGFFSVYTLPPNQAITAERQRMINRRLRQRPPERDVRSIILRKSASLLRTVTPDQMRVLREAGRHARFITGDARRVRYVRAGSIRLTVTSPPFLNMVDYAADNWLRCWFNGIDADAVADRITVTSSLTAWERAMDGVFAELHRLTAPGGWVAFEVGEVRRGHLRLDESILPIGVRRGFECRAVLINQQRFTKTSNIWGIGNNHSGTNTNRIVLFQRA
ncbi:MAG: site-specific DNA-methyltransferase [Bacteroidetes bacterium]|jgi:hypothetical protein|nr:site-specific DNA-methyltransferase [Bacteroidota bacterium]